MLIQNNADIDATNKTGDNALMTGMLSIHIYCCLYFILSILQHKASSYGFLDLIQLFLNNGSNINHKNNYGNNSLIEGIFTFVPLNLLIIFKIASWRGRLTAVQLLITDGVYVNHRNNFGDNALKWGE